MAQKSLEAMTKEELIAFIITKQPDEDVAALKLVDQIPLYQFAQGVKAKFDELKNEDPTASQLKPLADQDKLTVVEAQQLNKQAMLNFHNQRRKNAQGLNKSNNLNNLNNLNNNNISIDSDNSESMYDIDNNGNNTNDNTKSKKKLTGRKRNYNQLNDKEAIPGFEAFLQGIDLNNSKQVKNAMRIMSAANGVNHSQVKPARHRVKSMVYIDSYLYMSLFTLIFRHSCICVCLV